MAFILIKWKSRDEKECIKQKSLDRIDTLVIGMAVCMFRQNKDITTFRLLMADIRAAIRAYQLLFNEDLEYEVFPDKVILVNLTTQSVIRTITRKEVINND